MKRIRLPRRRDVPAGARIIWYPAAVLQVQRREREDHRAAERHPGGEYVMTGRPARGVVNRLMQEVGPMSPDAPAFPHAATGLAPLKAAAEKLGRVDFTNLWAGQAVRLGHEMPAVELTRVLAGAALIRLSQMAG